MNLGDLDLIAQKWNQYLSDYTLNLPSDPHRAGDFQPPSSLCSRFTSLFSTEKTKIHPKLQKPVTALHRKETWVYPGMPGGLAGVHKYSPVSNLDQKGEEIDLGMVPPHRKTHGDEKWEGFWRDVKSQALVH